MRKYFALFLFGIILSSTPALCCDCAKDNEFKVTKGDVTPQKQYREFKQMVKQIQKKNAEMGYIPPIEPIYIEMQQENPFLEDGLQEEM